MSADRCAVCGGAFGPSAVRVPDRFVGGLRHVEGSPACLRPSHGYRRNLEERVERLESNLEATIVGMAELRRRLILLESGREQTG